ncbi:MAG: hypothetical protein JWM28_1801, partial [Chitinophagaceae bacterium]|nr:hypothetical protein [Chitinophagaceae bacterium]
IIFPKWKIILISLVIILMILSEFYLAKINFNFSSSSVFFVSAFLFFIVQSSFMIIVAFDNFDIDIRKNFVFWIAFARLFYYLIIMFIYIYPSLIENGYKIKLYNQTNTAINTFANVLENIIYGVSFLCHKKKI